MDRRRVHKLSLHGVDALRCPTVESRRRQVAKRLKRSQPNRSLRIPPSVGASDSRAGAGCVRAACRRAQGGPGWLGAQLQHGSVEVQAEGNGQRLTELRMLRVAPERINCGSRVASTGADWFEVRPDYFQGQALTR